jgi:hypothetical protein
MREALEVEPRRHGGTEGNGRGITRLHPLHLREIDGSSRGDLGKTPIPTGASPTCGWVRTFPHPSRDPGKKQADSDDPTGSQKVAGGGVVPDATSGSRQERRSTPKGVPAVPAHSFLRHASFSATPPGSGSSPEALRPRSAMPVGMGRTTGLRRSPLRHHMSGHASTPRQDGALPETKL